MTSSAQERECFVYIVLPGETEFVTAGRLRVSPNREGVCIGEFVYGRRYRERANAVALDPVELRLQETHFETTRMGGFFGAIRDAMPDAWGRRVIEHRLRGAELDEFDYLLGGVDDRAGALGFGTTVAPDAPSHHFHRTLDLERLQSAADAIIGERQDLAGSEGVEVEELLEPGTSMGGARPKVVVQDDDALWIAKFSREADRWNQPRVEHGLLELGRRCGLNVAYSRLASVADRDVLLVRRFDRDRREAGYLRYRMVSALTLLRSTDNPLERAGWSYLRLADEIRRVSARPRDDLRELFARMCFNAAISNTDDHPRNHAVLAKDQDWRLSPAYDLTPTPMVARERRDLALVCGEHGRYANYGNLLSARGRFLLDQEEATATIDKIVAVVGAGWEAEMHRAGVSERDCERIAGAFLYEGFFFDLNE
jgi:serine/threonine-protein kinase HipA